MQIELSEKTSQFLVNLLESIQVKPSAPDAEEVISVVREALQALKK